MPTMQGSVLVPAGGVSSNQLAGLIHEFLSNNAALTLSVTSSGPGMNTTWLVAGQAIVNDSQISTQNRFPLVPDDILSEDGAFAGSRLILTFRNTSIGAITAFWRVDVEYA